MVTEGKKIAHWDAFFEDMEPVNSIAPTVAAVGNHETPRLSKNYENLYALPGNEYYYSIDYGPVHITILNTETLDLLDPFGDFSRDQRDWLIQDLAATHQPWKVVAFHRPYYSSGVHYADTSTEVHRELLEPILKQYEVDMVFNGHDHMYERSFKDGITYITTGGAGAPIYQAKPDANNIYSVKQVSEYHLTMIEASPTSLTLDAYFINGSMFDTFTLEKKTEELAVTRFEITEKPINSSSTFELKATVANFGETNLTNVPVEFQLGQGTWTELVDIDVNEYVEIITSEVLTISEKTVANITIDPLNAWNETSEANNFEELEIDFLLEGVDLTIAGLVSIGENPDVLNLGIEIANLGVTDANDVTIEYLLDVNQTVMTYEIPTLEGLERMVIDIGSFSSEHNILLEITIDPNDLITEEAEDNNYLLVGWNEEKNVTTSGATYAEYLHKEKNLKIGYGSEGILYAEPEVKLLWSIDSWTTYHEETMTMIGDSWEVEIETYSGMEGIAFGFKAEDQVIFNPAWVTLQAEGERGRVIMNLYIDLAITEVLTIKFVDSENFTSVPQIIEGWVIVKGVKYEPIHGEGYLQIPLTNMIKGKTYVYTSAWTQGYVAISETTLIDFSNSTVEPTETTDTTDTTNTTSTTEPSDESNGRLSIVLPVLGIAVVALTRRKKR
jgi:hypothetical protein